jgi:biopolymer transport protein ExbB/TolQ
MTFDWAELWTHMGFVARGVLLVLVLMSVISAGIIVDRLRLFTVAHRSSAAFGTQARVLMKERRFDDVLAVESRYSKSPLCSVVTTAVREYQDGMFALAQGARYDVIQAAERAVDRGIEMELSRLRKGLGGLASISSSAPFVGLFGTTFGIINSFRAIGLSGQGDLATVAPGIAEALLTTALGILVALPAIWFFNHLTARIESFSVDLHHAGSETVDFLIKDLGRRGAAAEGPKREADA